MGQQYIFFQLSLALGLLHVESWPLNFQMFIEGHYRQTVP